MNIHPLEPTGIVGISTETVETCLDESNQTPSHFHRFTARIPEKLMIENRIFRRLGEGETNARGNTIDSVNR